MAKGGGDFESPTFADHFDDPNIPEDEMTEMTRANQETQRIADQQIECIAHRTGARLERARKKVRKEKLNNFILLNKANDGDELILNPVEFSIKDCLLSVQPFESDKDIPLYERDDVV